MFMKKTTRFLLSLLFFFLFSLHSTASSAFDLLRSNDTRILQDVLKGIASRQKWDLEASNFSKLEVSKVRFGSGRRYDFRIRLGKSHLLFKFPDEVASWKKLRQPRGGFVDWVTEISSAAVLDSFKVEGPFELRVTGDDHASLSLPMNNSHSGLKRILVGEGITVEVSRAQEVSLFHSVELGLAMNRSAVKESKVWSPWHSSCMQLIPVYVSGQVSLFAYRMRSPDAHIDTLFLTEDTIELLPEKCYSSPVYLKKSCPIDSMTSRIVRLEKALGSVLGGRIHQNELLGSVNAKCKASTLIHLQLELEKNTCGNESLQATLAEWRTRPTAERLWFEVVARVEAEKLKPLMVKKVRPFIGVDTIAWSNLMSNISFTQFPSILVPPEALTLDVKW